MQRRLRMAASRARRPDLCTKSARLASVTGEQLKRALDARQRDAEADQRDAELLRDLATARLQAQLETMPGIEQAKDMIMDQEGCTAEEAFDLLRKASQSSNLPVRKLAALIVARNTRRSRNHDHHDPAA